MGGRRGLHNPCRAPDSRCASWGQTDEIAWAHVAMVPISPQPSSLCGAYQSGMAGGPGGQIPTLASEVVQLSAGSQGVEPQHSARWAVTHYDKKLELAIRGTIPGLSPSLQVHAQSC